MTAAAGGEPAEQPSRQGLDGPQADHVGVNVTDEGGDTSPVSAPTLQPGASPIATSSVDASAHVASHEARADSTITALGDKTIATAGRTSTASSAAGVTRPRKPCNCKNSKCLKLYCDCFAAGIYCEGCHCTNCLNRPAYEGLRQSAIRASLERNPHAFRSKVVVSEAASACNSRGVSERASNAPSMERSGPSEVLESKGDRADSKLVVGANLTTPTIKMAAQRHAHHIKGCSCLRSQCLKKYCECFQNGVFCSASCRCSNCRNYEGSTELTQARERLVLAELGISFSHQKGASGTPTKSSLTEMIEAGVLTEESIRNIGLEAVLEKARTWRKRSSGEGPGGSPGTSRPRRSKRSEPDGDTPSRAASTSSSLQASPRTPPLTWRSGFMASGMGREGQSPLATPAGSKLPKRPGSDESLAGAGVQSPSSAPWLMVRSPNPMYGRNMNMVAQVQHVWMDHSKTPPSERAPAVEALARLQSRQKLPHRGAGTSSHLPVATSRQQAELQPDAHYPKPQHASFMASARGVSLVSPTRSRAGPSPAVTFRTEATPSTTAGTRAGSMAATPTVSTSGRRDALYPGTPVASQTNAAANVPRVLDLSEAMRRQHSSSYGTVTPSPPPSTTVPAANALLLVDAAKRLDAGKKPTDLGIAKDTHVTESTGHADHYVTASWDEQMAADALQHLKNHSG
ncbi:Tesmin TSO1-like CXC domain containing protein [Cyanidiococcus yangmingshanensis]|uniref:Tesmin TSO1-like CXC domain containing protein n=1 Tax=Cyanidiococcus yangmingshanensis TaxID=2690220 RepID=A0A7J7IBF2_9RHOD|nr:Tesmin TSO1-like CXC domain containing protein [Cyanidiococcus yangmingshanensis]